MNFDDIINWKLLEGSHDFPGRDGGTCVMEAATVVAGFKYRSITEAEDLPDCFSRVIGSVAIWANDKLADEPRQELIKFIPRLIGSRDSDEVERVRLELVRAFIYDRLPPPSQAVFDGFTEDHGLNEVSEVTVFLYSYDLSAQDALALLDELLQAGKQGSIELAQPAYLELLPAE